MFVARRVIVGVSCMKLSVRVLRVFGKRVLRGVTERKRQDVPGDSVICCVSSHGVNV
jgi:hypothetical protein